MQLTALRVDAAETTIPITEFESNVRDACCHAFWILVWRDGKDRETDVTTAVQLEIDAVPVLPAITTDKQMVQPRVLDPVGNSVDIYVNEPSNPSAVVCTGE